MKAKLEHRIPLTKRTLGLLEFIHSVSGHCEFIFLPNSNARTQFNESSPNIALKRMGFTGRLVSHGICWLIRSLIMKLLKHV